MEEKAMGARAALIAAMDYVSSGGKKDSGKPGAVVIARA
jgi:hypothetical protein